MANYFPGRDLQLVTLKMSHGCSASLTNVHIGVFASVRYVVVKIEHSSFEIVL
jgi:hypothetical protein